MWDVECLSGCDMLIYKVPSRRSFRFLGLAILKCEKKTSVHPVQYK